MVIYWTSCGDLISLNKCYYIQASVLINISLTSIFHWNLSVLTDKYSVWDLLKLLSAILSCFFMCKKRLFNGTVYFFISFLIFCMSCTLFEIYEAIVKVNNAVWECYIHCRGHVVKPHLVSLQIIGDVDNSAILILELISGFTAIPMVQEGLF